MVLDICLAVKKYLSRVENCVANWNSQSNYRKTTCRHRERPPKRIQHEHGNRKRMISPSTVAREVRIVPSDVWIEWINTYSRRHTRDSLDQSRMWYIIGLNKLIPVKFPNSTQLAAFKTAQQEIYAESYSLSKQLFFRFLSPCGKSTISFIVSQFKKKNPKQQNDNYKRKNLPHTNIMSIKQILQKTPSTKSLSNNQFTERYPLTAEFLRSFMKQGDYDVC